MSEREARNDNFAPPRTLPLKFMSRKPPEKTRSSEENDKTNGLKFDSIGNCRELIDLVEKLMEQTCILKGRLLDSISNFQTELCSYSNKLSSRNHSGEGHEIRNKNAFNMERMPGGAECKFDLANSPSLYVCFSSQSLTQQPPKVINYCDLANKIQKIQEDLEDLRNKVLESDTKLEQKTEEESKENNKDENSKTEKMNDEQNEKPKKGKPGKPNRLKMNRNSKSDTAMLEDKKEEEEDYQPESKRESKTEKREWQPSYQGCMCKMLKEKSVQTEEMEEAEEECVDEECSSNDRYIKSSKRKISKIYLHSNKLSCLEGKCIRLQDVCKYLLENQMGNKLTSSGSKCGSSVARRADEKEHFDDKRNRNEIEKSDETSSCNTHEKKHINEIPEACRGESEERPKYSKRCHPKDYNRISRKECCHKERRQKSAASCVITVSSQIKVTGENPKCPENYKRDTNDTRKCCAKQRKENEQRRCSDGHRKDRDRTREDSVSPKRTKEYVKKCSEALEAKRQSGGCEASHKNSHSLKNCNNCNGEKYQTTSQETQKSREVSSPERKSRQNKSTKDEIVGLSYANLKTEKLQKLPKEVHVHIVTENNLPEAIKKCSGHRPIHDFFLSISPEQIQKNVYRVNIMDRKTGTLLGRFFIDEVKFDEAQAEGVFDNYLSVFVLNSLQSYKSFKKLPAKNQNTTETDEN